MYFSQSIWNCWWGMLLWMLQSFHIAFRKIPRWHSESSIIDAIDQLLSLSRFKLLSMGHTACFSSFFFMTKILFPNDDKFNVSTQIQVDFGQAIRLCFFYFISVSNVWTPFIYVSVRWFQHCFFLPLKSVKHIDAIENIWVNELKRKTIM